MEIVSEQKDIISIDVNLFYGHFGSCKTFKTLCLTNPVSKIYFKSFISFVLNISLKIDQSSNLTFYDICEKIVIYNEQGFVIEERTSQAHQLMTILMILTPDQNSMNRKFKIRFFKKANQSSINKIPFDYNIIIDNLLFKPENKVCTICQDEEKQVNFLSPCSHYFHVRCILKYLKSLKNNTVEEHSQCKKFCAHQEIHTKFLCPICRNQFML